MAEKYRLDEKSCFLVAEAVESGVTGRRAEVVAEAEPSGLEREGQLVPGRRLVGTVAVRSKEDKDMAEPPGTVG